MLVVIVLAPLAALAQVLPSAWDGQARLALQPRIPVQPAKVERDLGIEPQPLVRSTPQQRADWRSAAWSGIAGAAHRALTLRLVRPRTARSHDGAVWRVGFGWRAPPLLA